MIEELSTALSVANQLREMQKRIKDVEFKGLLADLQLALADVKVRCAALEEENIRLKRELAETKNRKDLRKNIVSRDGLYYLNTPVEGRPEGPYCPGCLDGKQQLIPLTKQSGAWKSFGEYLCPSCKEHFGKSTLGDDLAI
jgi:hypothetical protein